MTSYVFNLVDTNKDSQISPAEMKTFMLNIEPTITNAEVTEMIAAADTNNDGNISENEFASQVTNDVPASSLSEIYKYISVNGITDRESFIRYYELAQISPLYNCTQDTYINLLLEMIGPNETSFIDLWNFLQAYNE